MTTIAMEEYELMKDSKYRMYVAAVDKALKNFEYTSEWADLISALGKLNKVLTSYTKFPVIPRRIKISKRLAQCMHPALPSGVHLKALETYDIIFRCMGTVRLSHELFIYSAGLFPLLGHAAMNIRPTLLTIYETHFVPLQERLRPALSGFLSGVLPGLEPGSDHFDRTNTLLERVCDGVGPSWFYTCIWQCVRSNSPIRLPAISFVLAHYSRKLSMEDQLFLMGNDIDVMISGLCAAVQDSSVLVQRSALDLLMVCFPMQNTQLLYADMVRLVTAALTTILRRDMSLNRRLYSWLLSSEVNNTPPIIQNENFEDDSNEGATSQSHTIAYDLLNEAIRVILKQSSTEVPLDIKPYRLLTSLFDKPQIGPVILDNILYDVFRALYLSCLNQQKQKNNSVRCVSFNGDIKSLKKSEDVLNKSFLVRNCQDLIKNANLLFNTLQNYYIWWYIEKLYKDSASSINSCKKSARDSFCVNEIGSGPPSISEICILTDFLLDVIPVESYTSNTSEILPNLFKKIICTLKVHIQMLNKVEIMESLRLCSKILVKIQPVRLVATPKSEIEILVPDENLTEDKVKSVEVKVDTVNSELIEASKEIRGLEKSKSDSKINENLNRNELAIVDDSARERSNSNQMLKKKEKSSPKIDKKAKNKKSKSSSKLYDLKDEEPIERPVTENLVVQSVSLPRESPKINNDTIKIENKSLLQCLEEYKEFYISFIRAKIIPDVNINEYFRLLVSDKEERTRELELLLDGCLKNTHTSFTHQDVTQKIPKINFNYTLRDSEALNYSTAMSVASDVLLEFSTFPNLLNEEESSTDLPTWLETLVVCACSTKAYHDVQIIAMNTLLEIFSLAKSQAFERNPESTKVVPMGILENENVNYIENNTIVIEIMIQMLWDFIGILNDQNQLTICVGLLYQIHNIFDTKLFVEDILGRYLIAENLNVEFFKRFSVLWHLGRDLNIKLPAHRNNIRNFDRSVLKILDNLQNKKKSNLQLLSETFLTHSLLRNDISRIINPILIKLLAPRTARISILYVNIRDTDSQSDINLEENQHSDDNKERKVYAVSSINGNIKYHITDEPNVKPLKRKWYLFSKTGKKYTPVINMTTSITENSGVVTKKNKDFKNPDISPNMPRNAKGNNVKLFINPLSSKEIYPNGLDGSYTKLDPNASSSESLSSDLTPCDSPENLYVSYDATTTVPNTDRDSGFESLVRQKSQTDSITSQTNKNSETVKKNILEHLEPISDGIKANTNGVKMPKSQSFDENNCEKLAEIEKCSLVHSWSYCMSDSDNLNAELEISTSAEDFFKGGDHAIVSEVLNDIINRVCDTVDKSSRPTDLDLKPKISDQSSRNFNVFPMHHHLCLYYEVFDSNHVLYSLKTLKSCIVSNPQLFIRCLATSGLKDLKNNDILHLLARHRKSIFGGGFSGDLPQEHTNTYRGYTFLDVVISLCLNFSRSFYPSLDDPNLTADEINNNLKIQLGSLEILDIIIRNLLNLVRENSKGFSSYIADMLIKCKLQNILLHCLLTSVRDFDEDLSFAEEVLLFNNFQLLSSDNKIGEHVEAFQTQLLRVIHSLIILEYYAFPAQESNVSVQQPNTPVSGEHARHTSTVLVPQQNMFLSAIMSALRNPSMKSMHEKWCNMVTSCLPYFGENLKQISISVIHQICNNIEEIASNYKNAEIEGELCSDYAVTQLESLTILCHYCLLDSTQTINQSNIPNSTTTPLSNPSEILNNLVNAFFSPVANDLHSSNKHTSDNYQTARKTILSHMPRIISSVAKLWQTIVTLEKDYTNVYGNIKIVKQQLLEFLSPISLHHSGSFVAAVAVTWYERRNVFSNLKTVLPDPNASQSNLVYLISAIRVIPLDNLVQTVTAVIKNPPPTEGLSNEICLDVCVLELFYCYMRNASATQLSEAWVSILTLLREGCSLSPPAQFLLAALLHELMIKCCPLEERKDQKDLQDVTAKLIECVSQVCGSCLEQTTWLRRNFAVKEQDEDSNNSVSVATGTNAEVITGGNYSVQAQLVLSEILAPILDICFGSLEKDKVNTILSSLMYNIVPYLRTHTIRNMPSFQACSKLLASLSSYQYTRKAWKKDVYDLLLDNAFFQMDYSCLKYWKVIVDNLMTHDNTTFRDLMSRVSMTQSGSLSLFSSREQEYEQRAQLLKRLAFVIFCSEVDQYAKYMPDIQEQLTSSLRLSVPGVQAQVFLCFRVILLRMTPLHVTSLWPIIISEMLQVFLQIEQELATDTEEFSSHIKLLTSLDASWATNTNNGLHALGHPHWLRLQFATAKLLDLSLLLPATTLPQFQMYRWAFVGDDLVHVSQNAHDSSCFVPHVTRIANLMDQKFTDTQIETLPTKQNELLLTVNSIIQLKDLHGFFKTLSLCSNRHRTECSGSLHSDHILQDKQMDKKMVEILAKVDKVVETDFLDKLVK